MNFEFPNDFITPRILKDFGKGAFTVWICSTIIFKLTGLESFTVKTIIALLIAFLWAHFSHTPKIEENKVRVWFLKFINSILLYFSATLISGTAHAVGKLPVLELAVKQSKEHGNVSNSVDYREDRPPEILQFWYKKR